MDMWATKPLNNWILWQLATRLPVMQLSATVHFRWLCNSLLLIFHALLGSSF